MAELECYHSVPGYGLHAISGLKLPLVEFLTMLFYTLEL